MDIYFTQLLINKSRCSSIKTLSILPENKLNLTTEVNVTYFEKQL